MRGLEAPCPADRRRLIFPHTNVYGPSRLFGDNLYNEDGRWTFTDITACPFDWELRLPGDPAPAVRDSDTESEYGSVDELEFDT